jgi:hypothetical protein
MIKFKDLLTIWAEDTVFVVRSKYCTTKAKKSEYLTGHLLTPLLDVTIFNILIRENDDGENTIFCFVEEAA